MKNISEKALVLTDVEFAARRLKDAEGKLSIWGESLLKAYAQVSSISFVPSIVWAGRKDHLIFGSRIFNKLSHEGRRDAHLILSVRDPFRLAGMPSSFSYDLKSYGEIYRAVCGKRNDGVLDLQRRMLKIMDKTRAKIFVANSTIDPINRLWLSLARQSGLKTICLQHGIYPKAVPDYAQEEDIVDQYIALDDNQAAIVGRNINKDKIISLGKRCFFEWIPPEKGLKICFVGEDWERYYGFVDLKRILVDGYRALARSFVQDENISIYYKPHPSEQLFYGIDKEMRLLSREQIDEPDVYIGFSSSFLRDMATRGKLAIQIFDSRFNVDRFSENGYCMSLDNDEDLIGTIIETVQKSQTVPCIFETSVDQLLC